nr:MAG TPA: Nuclease [Caudoviricetes sp.]
MLDFLHTKGRCYVMKNSSTPTEHIEQALLFKWATFSSGKYPELEYMFAIPNGGYRHYRTAADLKSEGVKSGVPDIMLPVARGGYYGLFIEMKRTSGGRVSESQQKFLKTLNDNGYLAVVCKGFEQAQEAILKYLNNGVRK